MLIQSKEFGPIGTNSILLTCPETKKTAIIDAPLGCVAAWKKIPLEAEMILFTHSHWDHIADAAALKREFSAPIYIHKADALNLEKPGSDGLQLHFPIEGVKVDHYLEDGQELLLGNLRIKVIHTPGHTEGGVCFFVGDLLISGDTLFQGAIGRTDLPTSNPAKMRESLKKLAKLPKNTRVYPGHGDPTTIGEEL